VSRRSRRVCLVAPPRAVSGTDDLSRQAMSAWQAGKHVKADGLLPALRVLRGRYLAYEVFCEHIPPPCPGLNLALSFLALRLH
jgi:hypothetical protein